MACYYTYKGKTYSYDQLVSKIISSAAISTSSDVLYSITDSKQDQFVQDFEDIKLRAKATAPISGIAVDFATGGDPVGKATKDKLHLLSFLDDDRFRGESGEYYLPQMNDEEFIKNRAMILQNMDTSLSDQDAIQLAKSEFPQWSMQRQDAHIIHYIMRQYGSDITIADLKKVLTKLKTETPELKNRVNLMLNNETLLENLKTIHDKIVETRPKGSKVITDVPVQKKIHLPSGDTTIFDSIDEVVILEDGTIRVFKYKVAEEAPQEWGITKSPKVDKYRFELAFIKAMLEDMGFLTNKDRNKVELFLYAIQTDYDHEAFKDTGELVLKKIETNPSVIRMDVVNQNMAMGRHLAIARQFIQPALKVATSPEAIRKANAHMNRVWVGKNIQAEALGKTAEEWIAQNKDRNIFKLENIDGPAYKLIYPGHKPIYINEKTAIENNQELYEKVTQLISETQEHNDIVVSSLQSAINQAIHSGHGLDPSKLRGMSANVTGNISTILQPYFERELKEDGTLGELEWEYLKDNDLADYNILIFKNKKTEQLDIVSLTNLNLDTIIKFKMGRTSLAGSYASDIGAHQLPASWGNIYAMKTMILLNYILPNIIGNVKLGTLKVLTSYGSGSARTFNMQNLVQKYYNPLMNLVQENTVSEGAFENNFDSANFIDPYQSLLNEFHDIVRRGSLRDIENLADKVEALERASSDSVKIDQLLQLAKSIMEQYGGAGKSDEQLAIEASTGKTYTSALLSKISKVINSIRNTEVAEPVKISKLLRFEMKPDGIPSNNFKVIQQLWKETSQTINNEAYSIGLEINKILKEFYNATGYSYSQNKYIGNQTSQFKNLYEVDGSGKLLMRFKNPYDDSNNLNAHERTFLKKALLIFAKYRYMNAGKKFNFTDENSEALKTFINKNSSWYFNVPLKRASGASKLQTGYTVASFTESVSKMLKDPKLWARQLIDENALEEYIKEHSLEKDVTKLSVTNYFSYGEVDINGETFDSGNRDSQLAKHEDARYFETNVEDLLRDFTFESVRVQNMKKMVIASKLFLMQMQLSGRTDVNIEAFESEFDYIKDFLKVNVFGIPLMENSELAMAGFVLPAKRIVSKMFIAGNVAGAMRDTFEGFGQIMARAVTKYGTDISAGNVLKAYTIVSKDMITNRALASVISQLCIKYRMSNIDVSNVAEGMKTGKRGIVNFEEELYKTLKTPDFLNRMVLFVAKALEDGTWNAFSLNKDGELVYDWKKDKRFSLLAANDQTNLEEYKKQKTLFFNLIRLWNEEHPNNQITSMDTLPMPYSESQMEAFHKLSDNIWGSYDKANKAMGEHTLLMMTFGMFTTWMNGQVENYFKPLQESTDKTRWVQIKSNNNEPLFYNKDGSITTEDTGMPAMIEEPIMVQGIFQTLEQMYHVIMDGGSLKEEVFSNEENKDNMKKLLTDITMTLIYYALIKVALDALRDKQKEITDPHDIITNGICEVLYKGMYNAWDGFKGPLNLITFLGEQTNPPVYTESIAVTKDLFKFVAGDMTIMSFGSRHLAPIRSFKETIKAYETGKQPA